MSDSQSCFYGCHYLKVAFYYFCWNHADMIFGNSQWYTWTFKVFDRSSVCTHLYHGYALCVQWKLTHWGRVTQLCVSELTIIGSNNGLSPGRRQAIIWTNAGILLIRTSGTNFRWNQVKSIHFRSRKCIWKCHLWNGDNFVLASVC